MSHLRPVVRHTIDWTINGKTNYIFVESVTRAMAKVEKLGGKIHKPKTAVPQMGSFAICQDTENNTFALWERSEKAK